MPINHYFYGMHIHFKKNRSGTFSVVARLKSGRAILREVTFGSARKGTPEFEALVARAQAYVDEFEDNVVSLFNPEPEGYWEEPASPSGLTLEVMSAAISGIMNSDVRVFGPEMAFGQVYDKMGFGAIRSGLLRNLVICRIFAPASKLRTADYMERFLGVKYTARQIYYFMDRICPRPEDAASSPDDQESLSEEGDVDEKAAPMPEVPSGLRQDIEKISYKWTERQTGGTVTVAFYDTTTLYFESDEDDNRKPGWSKDGKHSNPQILLGLLISEGGHLIGWDVFEGNKYEGETLIPILRHFSNKFGFSNVVVVADAGLISKRNMAALDAEGYEYILGARVKSQSDSVKAKIQHKNLKNGDVKVVRLGGGRRMIVSKSEAREKMDRKNAEKGLARLQRKVASGKLTKSSINNRGYNKYLKMEGDVTITIDQGKFEEDKKWYGIKGYVTNTVMGNKKVIEKYHDLWYIERAFRFQKSDLEVRPIFHHLINRITGHVCICFIAYSIMLEIEKMLSRSSSFLTLDRVKEIVRNMYEVRWVDPSTGKTHHLRLGLDDEQKELMRVLDEDRIRSGATD